METIVLIHGLGADHNMWLRQVSQLGKEYHIFNPDLPGFGDEPALLCDGGQTLEGLADWLAAEIYTKKMGKVHLAGYSMGGTLALLLALRHPERVQTLSLLCTSARWGEGLRGVFSPLTGVGMIGRLVFEIMQAQVARKAARWCAPDELAILRRMLDGADRPRMAAHLSQLVRVDLAEELPCVSVPVLVAAGARDKLAPPAHARRLVRGLPSAVLRMHSLADHFFCVSHSDALTKMIRDQVDSHPVTKGNACN